MAWFRKDKKPLKADDRRDVPQDVFEKCKGCGEILYKERLAQNLNVCPNCGGGFSHRPVRPKGKLQKFLPSQKR